MELCLDLSFSWSHARAATVEVDQGWSEPSWRSWPLRDLAGLCWHGLLSVAAGVLNVLLVRGFQSARLDLKLQQRLYCPQLLLAKVFAV